MKISIAMCTYNGEKYLQEQLDSILKQTRSADEVIICDDGSTDATKDFIDNYIVSHSLSENWILYVNSKNLGYADNFHKALSLTTGDYIFFADQDDVWKLEKIEEMISVMETHKQITLLCSDFEPLVSTMDAPKVKKKTLKSMKNDKTLSKIDLSYNNIYIGSLGCLMCARRSFIDDIEQYWYSGWAHDEFVWKLAQCYDGCYVYHSKLILRRLHSSNVSMRKMHTYEKRIHYLRELIKSHEAMKLCAINKNLDGKRIKIINRNICAARLRFDMFEKLKLSNVFKLLIYIDCYHRRRSILMEAFIILKKISVKH